MCKCIAIVSMSVLLVALACPMKADIVSTYAQVPAATTGAGAITTGVFSTIPNLSSSDYADASQGHDVELSVVQGSLYSPYSGPTSKALDGSWPATDNTSADNVLFADSFNAISTDRLLMDLKSSIWIKEVNVYSRHGDDGARTPQNYDLYGSNTAGLSTSGDLVADGWSTILTGVVSQADAGGNGAKYLGVEGSHVYDNAGGSLGNYQYLLFDVKPAGSGGTSPDTYYLGTMYSEIDVVQAIPEPGTLALLVTGLIGLLAYAWKKRR